MLDMVAKEFNLDYGLIKKACDVISDVVSENKQAFDTMQFLCTGERYPFEDFLGNSVDVSKHQFSTEIFEKTKRDLNEKTPYVAGAYLNYILIPTLTHMACGWCPKNQALFDENSPLTKKYGLNKCTNEAAKLVVMDEHETPEGFQDREMLRKQYYDLFWCIDKNKKHLE